MSTEELYKLYRECGCTVSTDSRSVPAGAIFFALRGENFDGNEYALKALEAGASYAVVNSDAYRSGSADGRIIPVEDPFRELQALAIHHRETLGVPVIGLTGTNGKTTTKELIAAALGAKFRVSATKGNLNNDIGVPLTLLSMRPDTEIAVVEMGANHPDDIAKLVKVSRPDYGYITNVGKAHLLGFGSYEGVLAAKTELYKWLGTHRGSVIFVNTDHPDLAASARAQACHLWEFSRESSGVKVLETTADDPYLRLTYRGVTLKTRLVGAYNADNVLAALSIAEYFGVGKDSAVKAIEAYIPSNNRSQLVRTGRNTLIVDAYNANPTSMGLAIDNLASLHAGRKLALLGDMRELGAGSLEEHVAVVKKLISLRVPAYLVGEEFGRAVSSLGITPGGDCVIRGVFRTSEELASFIKEDPEHMFSSVTVLVKGSRGIRMETVIPEL